MSHTTKNYSEGGDKTVIGGTLEIADGGILEVKKGAKVIGLEGSNSDDGNGGVKLPFQPNSTATTIAALREDFNALLANLRSAGLMEDKTAE